MPFFVHVYNGRARESVVFIPVLRSCACAGARACACQRIGTVRTSGCSITHAKCGGHSWGNYTNITAVAGSQPLMMRCPSSMAGPHIIYAQYSHSNCQPIASKSHIPALAGLSLGSLPTPTAIASVGTIPQQGGATSSVKATNLATSVTWSPQALGNYFSMGMGLLPSSTTTTQPLILASSYPPVPEKLVDQIKAGRYVDMKDMLSNNISLLHSLEAFHPAMHTGLHV